MNIPILGKIEDLLIDHGAPAVRVSDTAKALLALLTITEREWEIGELLCEGFSRKEIADALEIHDRTVGLHLESMRQKTGTKTDVALARELSFRFGRRLPGLQGGKSSETEQECL